MKKTVTILSLLISYAANADVKPSYSCIDKEQHATYDIYESDIKSCTVNNDCTGAGVIEINREGKSSAVGIDISSGGNQMALGWRGAGSLSRIYMNFNISEFDVVLDGKFPAVKIICKKISQ